MQKKSPPPREIEIKLVIVSPRPADMIDTLSRKPDIAGCSLGKRQRIRLHDIYLDTVDQILQKERLSLRIRWLESKPWLTLKGKTIVQKWGGVDRLEIELPWSPAGWEEISRNLSRMGIILPDYPAGLFPEDPLESLQKIGLRVIQDRRTVRWRRSVLHPTDPQQVLAELAFDTVTYRIGDQMLYHYEMEIEAKDPEGQHDVRNLANSLLQAHPFMLKKVTYSKLTLGMLLPEMAAAGVLGDFQGPYNNLLPAAYEWIDFHLKNMENWKE